MEDCFYCIKLMFRIRIYKINTVLNCLWQKGKQREPLLPAGLPSVKYFACWFPAVNIFLFTALPCLVYDHSCSMSSTFTPVPLFTAHLSADNLSFMWVFARLCSWISMFFVFFCSSSRALYHNCWPSASLDGWWKIYLIGSVVCLLTVNIFCECVEVLPTPY